MTPPRIFHERWTDRFDRRLDDWQRRNPRLALTIIGGALAASWATILAAFIWAIGVRLGWW